MRGARVILPYTKPHETTAAVLTATGMPWTAEWVGGSDRDYFDLLDRTWRNGGTFTVVEHDIVPTVEALKSLNECGNDWCACSYPYLYGERTAGLGCTRFRSALIVRHPDLFEVVATMTDAGHPPMHWCRLDAWTRQTLTTRGESRCEAHSQIEHVMAQRGSSHGCYFVD